MKKILIGIAAAALMAPAFADEMATPDEAKAMSEKAQSAVNEMGSEAAFAAFADPDGDFQEKDLYVFCMDMDGVMLSHAVKPELAGKNLLDFNEYGDLLFQDMVTLAQESGEGWVDYNWPYPGTDEIKQKTSYIASNDEGFFCGVGAYK
ncbi:cache domain-containing protein [Ectothiorhodospira marina]|uniref:Cache domain-containing protein n=1 Tax=Ectothiorhodospira marina TaxID=1396821 RepID=A0A1H7KWR1_9GAMM|nr:cache domain-containing protein [Ectothiorhodospira marina]SEK90960.1 Cache domain-containing protein [Ectothiorhodospira marina]